ncbi:hypothetical protein Tco_1155456 [Tanacetum coccineum]
MKHSYLNDDTCININVIDEILEEYFDALLDEEFDIKIEDKKGTENVVADHLSRIDNDETSDVNDNFPGETLMEITTNDTPWFADFVNYLVGDVIPKGMTYQQKNKFFSSLKNYFWEDPYLFNVVKMGVDKAKNHKKTVKTGQTRTREQKSTQRAGRMLTMVNSSQPSVKQANSRDKVHLGRVYTSPSTLIGGDTRKNDTVDMKEAQGNKAYTLEVLTKKARPVTITDCHTGNPCELEIDLTAKSSSPIIEGMYGQD